MRQFFASAFVLSALVLTALSAESATVVEKPAAVDGTAYAVIAPVFNSSSGSQSYVRLFNGGASTATISVTVIGSPSARTYGTANIAVPADASPQLSIGLILTLANASALSGGDTAYALYLQSTEPRAGYQHVIFNSPTQLFQNASVCTTLIDEVLGTSSGRVLTNMHTSKLPGYPSNLYLHNYRNVPVTYRVTVIDAGYADSTTGAIRAGSGAIIGSQDIAVGANTTYTKPFSYFESALGWTPTATQYHANVIVTNPNGGTSYDLVSQTITSQSLNGELDLSTTCAINPPTSTTNTATTFAGTLVGDNGDSGTLTVTVQGGTFSAASAPLTNAKNGIETAQSTAQASGVLIIGSTATTLSGTYDSTQTTMSLSGGGYVINGTFASGVYSGTYTGPNNSTGAFSTLNATASPVTRYCGTWTRPTKTGTFNTQLTTSGTFTGVITGSSHATTISGQLSGSTITGTTNAEWASFQGTVSTTGTISGSFVNANGNSGTFSGSTCS